MVGLAEVLVGSAVGEGVTHPNLIQFWRLRRMQRKEPCIVRPFHKQIARKLTELTLGTLERPNLMILMPPRCAKTDLGVRTYVPWAMSYFPDSEFILSSYGSELATDNAIDIRSTLSSDWYRSIVSSDWGARVQMRGEKAGGRQDHFFTEEGGSVKAIGRGGGITGFGAGKLRPEFGGCILMDDMLKAQEARSAAARKEAINYYTGTLKTRRNRNDSPKTPIVLIMQRLHGEDLAGYCLREERDEWDVLQIPAHDENETIWPGRIGMEEMLLMRDINPEDYWAQYMQNPTASAFQIFKRSYWRYWNNVTKVEQRVTLKVITADTAFKAQDVNDWSVLQCWGFESTRGMYLLDQVRGRWEFPELMAQSEAFWRKHHARRLGGITPATEFWVEDKASGQSLVQMLRQKQIPARGWTPDENLAKTSSATPQIGVMTSTDKVARAQQCTMPLSAGRIFIPDPKMPGFQWVDGFINEHEAFTTDDSHLFDDVVDTFTEACLIWQARGGGRGAIPVWEEAA